MTDPDDGLVLGLVDMNGPRSPNVGTALTVADEDDDRASVRTNAAKLRPSWDMITARRRLRSARNTRPAVPQRATMGAVKHRTARNAPISPIAPIPRASSVGGRGGRRGVGRAGGSPASPSSPTATSRRSRRPSPGSLFGWSFDPALLLPLLLLAGGWSPSSGGSTRPIRRRPYRVAAAPRSWPASPRSRSPSSRGSSTTTRRCSRSTWSSTSC